MAEIVINNFQKGIGQSSYVGFELIRGLNITDKPGVAYPNLALVKESSTTIDEQIIATVFDNQGQLWAISDTKLFKRTTAGSWSSIALNTTDSRANCHNKGIAFWGATTSAGGNKPKGFIFLIYDVTSGNNGQIDILSLADETTWTGKVSVPWTNIGGGTNLKRTFVASNNILYIAKGTSYGFASIAETSFNAFDGTTGTATITQSALTLPSDYFVGMFKELGSKLLILANKAGDDNGAMIFPWDKTSADFEIPIKLYEDGDYQGWQAVVIGLKAYIHCGKRGQWYVTNGTEAVKFARLPASVTDLVASSTVLYPDAADVVNGLIYFGISTNSTQTNLGIYSLNPETGAINFEHIISQNVDGTSAELDITSIKSLGNKQFLCTWGDVDASPTYGADKVDTNRYTTDLAYLISPFLRVGNINNKKSISTFEVQLTKPLASGDSVKLYYRTAQNGSWLSVNNGAVEDSADDTLSLISTVGDQSKLAEYRNIECENIQVKCVLNKAAELLEIRII